MAFSNMFKRLIITLLEAPITGVSDSFIIFKFIIEREERERGGVLELELIGIGIGINKKN